MATVSGFMDLAGRNTTAISTAMMKARPTGISAMMMERSLRLSILTLFTRCAGYAATAGIGAVSFILKKQNTIIAGC